MNLINDETPSGVINGVNKTFTTAFTIETIVSLFLDGSIYFNFTFDGTTITLNDAPTTSIVLDYNTPTVSSSGGTIQTRLTTSKFKTLLTEFRGASLGGADDNDILRWANFVNQFVREEIANVNPDDFLITRTIKTIADTQAYTLASDFEHLQYGGFLDTNIGTQFAVINYDAQTGNYTEGLVVTGGTSGATGILTENVDYGSSGTLRIQLSSGSVDFVDNEIITDTNVGSATADGAQVKIDFSNRQLPETEFGSSRSGYWVDGSNMNITPVPKTSKVYIYRYLPTLSELTAINTTQTLVIPNLKYDEFVRNSAEVYWQMWRNSPDEAIAGERARAALKNMLKRIKKTPAVMKFSRRDALYRTMDTRVGKSISENIG